MKQRPEQEQHSLVFLPERECFLPSDPTRPTTASRRGKQNSRHGFRVDADVLPGPAPPLPVGGPRLSEATCAEGLRSVGRVLVHLKPGGGSPGRRSRCWPHPAVPSTLPTCCGSRLEDSPRSCIKFMERTGETGGHGVRPRSRRA